MIIGAVSNTDNDSSCSNSATTFQYDAPGRLWRETRANDVRTTHTYDVRGRKTGVLHEDLVPSPVTVSTEVYAWDAADRMTAKTVGGVTTTYGHDAAGQLLTETRPGWVAAYTYDANGNRLTRTLNGVTETYTYGPADKLLTVVSSAETRLYHYDPAGRTTAIESTVSPKREMVYDDENRVTQVSVGGVPVAQYAYNGLDTRVWTDDSGGPRDWLRDGAYVTDPVLQAGATRHVPGVSERTGSVSSFALSDYIGTASHQTDASGAVTGTRTYDAFGVAQGTPAAGTFGYKGGWGYQEDPGTGFRLLGHRYYDSDTGRFLTRDPIKDGRNWYAYGGGEESSLSGADPDGLRFAPIRRILEWAGSGVRNFTRFVRTPRRQVQTFPDMMTHPLYTNPTIRGGTFKLYGDPVFGGFCNGRWYTGHGVARMIERKLNPSDIENVIRSGVQYPGSQPFTRKFHKDGVTVVINRWGDVVTAMRETKRKKQ